jgi:carboxyl-terminal processing protease
MSRGHVTVLLSLLSCTAVSSVAATGSCRAQGDYDQITATVTEKFYDKTFRGLDWPSRVAYYKKLVRCPDDEAAVAVQVNRLLSELHASHTALYTKADIDYWALNSLFSSSNDGYPIEFAGIWPQLRDGHWYARYVFEDSPAARAGLVQGDRLSRLNGNAFSPFAFTGKRDSLTFSRGGDAPRETALQANHQSVISAFISASAASRQILKAGGKRVGYFHLWTARDVILRSLKDSLLAFEAARVDALIIDLRGGYGGTSPDYLEPVYKSAFLQSIPKYFLIDDGVRSGKEMLAALVKRDKLGTLVGSKTAGGFLGAGPFRLLDDRYFLLLAVRGGVPMDLPPIEGVGVRPDVPVAACRARCATPDTEIARALKLIGAPSR